MNDLLKKFKTKVKQTPHSLSQLNGHFWILLKEKCMTKTNLNISPDHNKVYNDLIERSVWEEQGQIITLQLIGYSSLCHKSFLNSILTVLKLKGPRDSKGKSKLDSNPIKFPYSRNEKAFPPVQISGESKTINMFEFSFSGVSGMIIIGFFLQSILKTFLRSVETVPNRGRVLIDEEDDLEANHNALPSESDADINVDDEVYDKDQGCAIEESRETNSIESDAQMNVEDGKAKKHKDECRESVSVEIVTDDEDSHIIKEMTEESYAKSFTCKAFNTGTAMTDCETIDISDKKTKDKSEAKELKVAQICYICSLIDIMDNIKNILKPDQMKLNFECTLKCIHAVTCLESLGKAITSLVCSNKIDEIIIQHLKRNVGSILINVLDHSPFTRADLYCQVLENLDNVAVEKRHRIMNLLRELCEELIGNDVKSFEETLRRNKSSRRNMIRFLTYSGNFFSIHSVLESWHIMHCKGIDIKRILPPSMEVIVQMFNSAPEMASSDYFLFMADITRKLITDVLKDENLVFLKTVRIEFKSGPSVHEKLWDLYIYLNKKEMVMCHFLWDGSSVVCEEIEFSKLLYDEDRTQITTENWNFVLHDALDIQLKSLLQSSVLENVKGNKMEGKLLKQSKLYDKTDQFEKVDNIDNDADNPQYGMERSGNSGDLEDDDDGIDYGPDDSIEDSTDNKGHGKGPRSGAEHLIKTSLTVTQENVLRYWRPKQREFSRTLCAQDWPKNYRCPCAVVFTYSHAKIVNSAKRISHFAKVAGKCKICQSKHICIIKDSPFDEVFQPDGSVKYKVKSNMVVDVHVIGKFELDEDDKPDITAPKHDLMKASGLFLKGREREIVGERASKIGVQNVYMEQYDNVNEEQLKAANKTSVKSYNVIKMARQEHEKKQRCGNDFFESVQNIIDSQQKDISLNFENTKSNRELAGFVRSAQRTPFKIFMANYDQLHVGAKYLNNTENSMIFMDSSGKFLKQEKGKSKYLNTAVVIPPPAKGQSPFPIFEMVSEKNRTIDFQTFLEYGFSYLSTSINNEKVRNPSVAVSDFSFANIHSILEVFNKMKISEYLETSYTCSLKNDGLPFSTILVICENHFMPSLLQYARNLHADKTVSDTVVAGLMKVFQAESLERALQVFRTLVDIHCAPEIDQKAREMMKEANFDDVIGYVEDFGDDAPTEDDLKYGSRKGLRINSPYFKLFNKIIDKKLSNNGNRKITNKFFAPKLIAGMTKQYLSLFPILSASMLPDKTLKTNSYVELYWKDQRRILQDVPDRLKWPPRYLGNLHSKIRRDAKSIISHGLVPNLKHGGKVRPGQAEAFKKYLDENRLSKTPKKNLFIPAGPSKNKPRLESNESFGATCEKWDSQRSKSLTRRKENYIKNKTIDYDAIIDHSDIPVENLKVTGSRLSRLTSEVTKEGPAEFMVISQAEIQDLVTKDSYISSAVVDSGLILLDKRFNEDSNMKDVLNVYTIDNLRLILGGEPNLVNKGKFVTVMPRDFGMEAEIDRFKEFNAGRNEDVAPGSHYTLVSNLHCADDEVNIYETYQPFRNPKNLLRESGVKVIKMLTKSNSLKVNCMNVQDQTESECGAIALGLAVQLCFYPAGEGATQYRMHNVRRELFRCLHENQLSYFKCSKVKSAPQDKVLFTMTC